MLGMILFVLMVVATVCVGLGVQARQQGSKRQGAVLIGVGVAAVIGAAVWLLRGMINT